MKKQLNAKKFIVSFFGTVAVLIMIMITTVYCMDPWLYYRIPENNKMFLDGLYTSAGITKNAEYDTAIIGSSYFQDFRMDWFREKLGCEPINLTAPGLNPYETVVFSNNVTKKGKAKNIIICLTYYTFENGMENYNRIPKYLYDDNVWNDYQYFFSYEAWMKFIPMDMASVCLGKIKPDFMERYKSLMNRDELGNTSKYYNYSQDEVFKNYKKSQIKTDDEKKELLEYLKFNFDAYLEKLELREGVEYTFILPAHSALYWFDLKQSDQYNTYMEFEKYVVKCFEKYDNVKIINTQTFDEIIDLDNYRDFTHFNLDIQEKIVDVLNDEQYILTENSVEEKQEQLEKLVEQFEKDYEERLKNIQ